jgi:hypothetical protein
MLARIDRADNPLIHLVKPKSGSQKPAAESRNPITKSRENASPLMGFLSERRITSRELMSSWL